MTQGHPSPIPAHVYLPFAWPLPCSSLPPVGGTHPSLGQLWPLSFCLAAPFQGIKSGNTNCLGEFEMQLWEVRLPQINTLSRSHCHFSSSPSPPWVPHYAYVSGLRRRCLLSWVPVNGKRRKQSRKCADCRGRRGPRPPHLLSPPALPPRPAVGYQEGWGSWQSVPVSWRLLLQVSREPWCRSQKKLVQLSVILQS